jgi:DnaK suppressor protein
MSTGGERARPGGLDGQRHRERPESERALAERLEAERAAAARQLAALSREFGGIVEAASQANADDEHDPEGATIAFERQHIAALADQVRERLAQVDAALHRLDDGSYGTCERCGQPIGAERLAARPAAATCVRCAALR